MARDELLFQDDMEYPLSLSGYRDPRIATALDSVPVWWIPIFGIVIYSPKKKSQSVTFIHRLGA